MGYNLAIILMSERFTKEITETDCGDHIVVNVVTEDEDGGIHVGTDSYEKDTWHTDSDREEAHKNATEKAYSPYN